MKRRIKVAAALTLTLACLPFMIIGFVTLVIGMGLYSLSEEIATEKTPNATKHW